MCIRDRFKSTAGIDAQIVPYNGSPALIGAIRGQQVDVAVEILAPVLTQIQGGALRALAVPSKTPRAVVERLHKEIATAVADPGVREKLRGLNIDARSSTPEQNAALLASDIRRWSGVIEKAKIQKQ